MFLGVKTESITFMQFSYEFIRDCCSNLLLSHNYKMGIEVASEEYLQHDFIDGEKKSNDVETEFSEPLFFKLYKLNNKLIHVLSERT